MLKGNQNNTLYHSDMNGITVHLFEVMKKSVYTYRGVAKFAGNPYKAEQPDEKGNMRKVWVFPLKLAVDKDSAIGRELSENEIVKLSNRESARRAEINPADKKPKITETIAYYRDPYLKEMVRRIAEGKCQFCGKQAPFIDRNGEPYLEEHHVKRLADGGRDAIDNVVEICPNCHRKVHILSDATDKIMLESIARQNKEKLQRLLAYEKDYRKSKI